MKMWRKTYNIRLITAHAPLGVTGAERLQERIGIRKQTMWGEAVYLQDNLSDKGLHHS
jgi:hypothetical protein